jgi:vitamin B12 transporter
VINIITKKGDGPPSFYVSGEYGSFNTFRESAGVRGGNELLNYSASISHIDTDGISAANEKDGNDEEDGYKETAVSTRLGLTPTDNLSFDFFLNYGDARTELDDAFGIPVDDPNSTQDTESLFLRTQATASVFENLWEQTVDVSYSDTDRKLSDDPNPGEISGFDMTTEGELLKFDWQHNLYLHETNTLTLGVETEEEQMVSKDSFGGYQKNDARTTGYYIQDQIKLWDAFFTTVGVRVDDHEEFGSETTFRVVSAYLFKNTGTKIKGSYGEGFKAPSLYQLFGPDFPGYPIGNPDLKPEKSKGWDVGIEQEFFDGRVTLGATYFENRFKDLIDFVDFVGYINRSRAEAEGVELIASIRPCEDISIAANYTYTDTEDKTTGEELPRRAKDKAGVDVNYRFNDKTNLNLNVVYVGDRLNLVGGERVGGYTLVNLAASYDINEHLQWFARIDNLFDRDYEEVAGFGTPGFSVFSGLKLMF